uniref:Zinc finger RNA binding protein 2 n=1 Tax=Gorilla gorilla gorilla TaxID=9595 RepID=A0A2I2YZC3_GORGO
MNLPPDRTGLLSLSVSPEVETTPPALASGLPCALPWTVGCSGSDAVTALSPSLRGLACICSILWDPAW